MNMSVGRTTLSAQTPHSLKPSVGGDALIAPHAAAAPRHQASLVQREVSQPLAVTDGLSKRIFRAPARGTFALGGKSTQKRRSNLRFENPFARLHPPRILTAFATRTLCRGNFTEMLHCLCFSFRCRFCSEMQSCAVLYLVCRGGVLRCGAKRNKCPWGTPPAI